MTSSVPGWADALDYFTATMSPGFGRATLADDPRPHPFRDQVLFTGSVFTELAGVGVKHVALAEGGQVTLLHPGSLPRWSPDGTAIAFATTDGIGIWRERDVEITPVTGTIEELAWDTGGSRLLVGLAEPGAALAGGQGSGAAASTPEEAPSWAPKVRRGPDAMPWRRAAIFDVASATLRIVSPAKLNIWELCWAGPDHIAAVCTEGSPSESQWYSADLRLLPVDGSAGKTLATSHVQLGLPVATPSGHRIAWVEAVCSDRQVIAGDVHVLELATGERRRLPAPGDVTDLRAIDDERLGVAGLDRLETFVAILPVDGSGAQPLWSASDSSCGWRYPQAGFRADGTAAFAESGWRLPTQLVLHGAENNVVASLAHPGTDHVLAHNGTVALKTWTAPDGLEIDGLLCAPATPGPHPLVVYIHGGPVWAFRNGWQLNYAVGPYLVSRGFAVLYPNPRGSGGRGQEFARAVFGDMGGADTDDFLSGIDALIADGSADAGKLGVTGGSYGGFMSSWLPTQDPRFAAAVPIAPVTNWFSQHGTSNIQDFDELFLDGKPRETTGLYATRSPVFHAANCRTPMLLIAGALDECTPPTQALEMHTALLDAGVESECVTYPEEGHGIYHYPAVIDFAARTLDWFERFMPATAV